MKRVFITISILVCLSTNIYALEANDKISIYGYVTQGYMKSDANNYLLDSEDGSFQMREMLITFSSQIAYNVHVGAQIAAIDLGDVGNNEPVLDWAFGDYQLSKYLGIRAGRIKGGGVGLYNETRDIDIVRNGIFLPASVYNPLQRDLFLAMDGISAYGNIGSIPGFGNLFYSIGFGTTSLKEDGMTSKWIENFGLMTDVMIDVGDIVLGSLIWLTPIEGLRVGGSYLHSSLEVNGKLELNPEWYDAFQGDAVTSLGFSFDDVISGVTVDDIKNAEPPDVEIKEDPMEMMIFSTEFLYDNLTLAGEYAETTTNRKMLLGSLESPDTQTNTSQGYYVSAAYRFADWLEIGLMYGMYFADKDDPDGKKAIKAAELDSPNRINEWALAQANKYAENQGIPAEVDNIETLIEIAPALGVTTDIRSILNVIYPRVPQDFELWQHTATITTRFDINENWVFKLEYSAIDGTALTLLQDNDPDELKQFWNLVAAKAIFVF